jgi:hypothetical protein
MKARKGPEPEQRVVVIWQAVAWDETPPDQRAAWDELWRRLLDPVQSRPERRPPQALRPGAGT